MAPGCVELGRRPRLGKLWVRGGKVYAYVYPKGKKGARKLLHFWWMDPKDLLKPLNKRNLWKLVRTWDALLELEDVTDAFGDGPN